jgi:putative ABC transport system permease protein
VVDWFAGVSALAPHISTPVLFGIICVAVVAALIWFLHTELGLAFLATGNNKQMITSQGVNTDTIVIFGVGLSNALVAASGALVAQNQGAADVNMGVGTIIAGLASVIIGETVFGNRTITRAIIAALLGSILYRVAIALALGLKLGSFSITPSDLNLITALLVVIALVMPQIKSRMKRGLAAGRTK